MVDADTFLTALYVAVDDFCKAHLPPAPPCPGPAAALTRGERGFYRHARRHPRAAFPALPARERFNRRLRRHGDALMACCLHLGGLLQARRAPYEALDTAAVPTRDARRRGPGRLPGLADIGRSNRLGWFEGVRLLLAVTPAGAITGFGLGPERRQGPAAGRDLLRPAPPAAPARPRRRRPRRRPVLGRQRGSRTASAIGTGRGPTGRRCSARPSAPARAHGPGRGGAGWPASAGSWRRSSARSSTPSASIASGRTPSPACKRAWRPRWRCTTSASGSTRNSAGPTRPSPIWSTGDAARSHTKRLRCPR